MDEVNIVSTSDLSKCEQRSWWTRWLGWLPTSNEKLVEAEQKILARVSCHLDVSFVPVLDSLYYLRTLVARNYPFSSSSNAANQNFGPVSSSSDSVNLNRNPTFSSSDSTAQDLDLKISIVLLHGFASGCGLWCKNLASLSKFRRVYAFDMLGFGRSSRPEFPLTPEEVENMFVEVIESWREQLHLEKFILIGHSMGGYLATSYAISYPKRVVHLILADPWGFIGQQNEKQAGPSGMRGWLSKKLNSFRALSTLRFFGPFGPPAMRLVRQDFADIFYQLPDSGPNPSSSIEGNSKQNSGAIYSEPPSSSTRTLANDFQAITPFDPAVVYNYMYHINARHPSGEDAFLRMSKKRGWAARPMLNRITQLNKSIPISFCFGARSWVDSSSGLRARELLSETYVDIMVIDGGGHHAYAQYADEFNSYVNAIASLVDRGHEFRPGSENLVQAAAREMLPRHQSPSSDSLVRREYWSWSTPTLQLLGGPNSDLCFESSLGKKKDYVKSLLSLNPLFGSEHFER